MLDKLKSLLGMGGSKVKVSPSGAQPATISDIMLNKLKGLLGMGGSKVEVSLSGAQLVTILNMVIALVKYVREIMDTLDMNDAEAKAKVLQLEDEYSKLAAKARERLNANK